MAIGDGEGSVFASAIGLDLDLLRLLKAQLQPLQSNPLHVN